MSPQRAATTGRPVVFLTAFAPENPTLQRLRRLVRRHRPETADLTDDPREADVVLYVESGYAGLREAFRAHSAGGKAVRVMFSETDWPFPFLPGLFPSLTRPRPWAASWAYLLPPGDAAPATPRHDPPHLFSFLGRVATHPVRQRIAALDGPDTPCLDVADAPGRFPDWDYRRSFEELVLASRFVLCPRGIGSASIRIFEAMRLGRVPVIVSDAWQEPPIGDWSAFSIRVPEARIADIPFLCRNLADASAEMGAAAGRAFRRFFAPEQFFDAALARLLALSDRARGGPAMSLSAVSLREFREPVNALRRRIASVAPR
ncbi:MAG: exostosin family protein [Bauldia sp.]|nr:exostosin family protein [Bauldia sp.]